MEVHRRAWREALAPKPGWRPIPGKDELQFRSGTSADFIGEVLRSTVQKHSQVADSLGYQLATHETHLDQDQHGYTEGWVKFKFEPKPTT